MNPEGYDFDAQLMKSIHPEQDSLDPEKFERAVSYERLDAIEERITDTQEVRQTDIEEILSIFDELNNIGYFSSYDASPMTDETLADKGVDPTKQLDVEENLATTYESQLHMLFSAIRAVPNVRPDFMQMIQKKLAVQAETPDNNSDADIVEGILRAETTDSKH